MPLDLPNQVDQRYLVQSAAIALLNENLIGRNPQDSRSYQSVSVASFASLKHIRVGKLRRQVASRDALGQKDDPDQRTSINEPGDRATTTQHLIIGMSRDNENTFIDSQGHIVFSKVFISTATDSITASMSGRDRRLAMCRTSMRVSCGLGALKLMSANSPR